MTTLKTCESAPPLDLPLVGGGRWRLDQQRPTGYTLVVFYRGLHCPRCKNQLMELNSKLDALSEVGVGSVVAVSGATPTGRP